MASSPLSQLLKLPAGDRVELAIALWESLSDSEREQPRSRKSLTTLKPNVS
jgi:hypothetical protein